MKEEKNIEGHEMVKENGDYFADLIVRHKEGIKDLLHHIMNRITHHKDACPVTAQQLNKLHEYVNKWSKEKRNILNYAAAENYKKMLLKLGDISTSVNTSLLTVFCLDAKENIVADTLVKTLDEACNAILCRISIEDTEFKNVNKYNSLEEYCKDMLFTPLLSYHDQNPLRKDYSHWHA